MVDILISLVQIVGSALLIMVIVKVVLSYFLTPYHPIRVTLDRFFEPILAPIRRVVPPLGMIDFSPLILIIAIQLLESALIMILSSLR